MTTTPTPSRSLAAATAIVSDALALAQQPLVWADIQVRLEGNVLVLSNTRLERWLDLSVGLPRTISLIDRDHGCELASPDRQDVDFTFMGYNLPHHAARKTHFTIADVCASHHPSTPAMPEHVLVTLSIHDSVQALQLERTYALFPNQPYMACQAAIRCGVEPNIYWSKRCQRHNHAGQIAEHALATLSQQESVMDSVRLAQVPTSLRRVSFFARTDYDDKLMETACFTPRDEAMRWHASLTFCDLPDGQGLFYLQEAPHSDERRDIETADVRFEDNTLHSLCWGIEPHEVQPDQLLWGYRHILGLYHGDASAAALAVKACQAHRFPKQPGHDGVVMVNPWGGGKFLSSLSQKFLEQEIHAAAQLGATHYQIDDGWEQGGTLKELTHHNRAITTDFWQPRKDVMPQGLAGLSRLARQEGVELALWVSPHSNQSHRDWRNVADLLLSIHRSCGIRHFKFDGIMTRTKAAEDHLQRLLRALRHESQGQIVVDFDVTNGQRPGFILFQEHGIVFPANRYVCHNWGRVYHPQRILHQLWQFAHYLRLQNLQAPVTDPDIINHAYFDAQDIESPDVYDTEYWAAVTLFANPLLWLIPSRLKPAAVQTYRRMIDLHHQHRQGIHAGEIFPVGDEPTGQSICGFQSHQVQSNQGYLIVYREKHALPHASLPLHFAHGQHWEFTSLSDHTPPLQSEPETGRVRVELDKPGSYRLYRYQTMQA